LWVRGSLSTVKKNDLPVLANPVSAFEGNPFTSGSGDKRGHGKTPLFMAGMKCLPLCKVPLLSAANNYVESQNEPRVKK
jgi:hypothetical protein